ncbi:MAG: pyruvate formate lyase family protein [Candidatus Latescibacterota bacterium]
MNERLRQYQQQATIRGAAENPSPKEANLTKAFFEIHADLPLAERQARSYAYALENEPVCVHPLSRLVGQIYQVGPGSGCPELTGEASDPRWRDYAVYPQADAKVRECLPDDALYALFFGGGAFPGHVCWDFGRMLEIGVSGVRDLCGTARGETTDPKSLEFYSCVEIALGGLENWVGRHVLAISALLEETFDPEERRELSAMIQTCQRVPEFGAATFREAVQSFYFQHLAVMFENPFGGNGPGRLDYYLWPYLEADLAAGRTTMDQARELITELFIRLHERIAPGDGWVEAIPVGGRNPDGTSAINPLSYMMIEVISSLKQTHPSVYVRLHENAPEDFLDLSVDYLIGSGNRAQIYGDDAIIAALLADGVSIEDARHWTAGGCMEVSPQGCNCDLLFSFAHNVSRTFELVLNGGCLLQTGERAIVHTKSLADYTTFEEFYADFAEELGRELGILTKRLDAYLACYATYRPSFLLSSMTHDCMERGRTLNEGGARYMDYGGSGVGIPNVGDSLFAIKRAVFDEKRFTGKEVLDALKADFVGYDRMRAYLVNLPKYGAGHEEADAMVDRMLCTFASALRSHRNPYGGHARAVILGFIWVVSYGLEVGATPDGRKAGRPLAHGLSPQSGSAVSGITQAICSATRLSLDQVGGGGSMMWDLDASWATPAVVKPLLKTFLQQGGHIFQGNVIPVDRLLDAKANPESHRDLMVRVGGYSARFVTLSRETQDEIITRYRYDH